MTTLQSVAQFARELKVPDSVLLEQLRAAGVHKHGPNDVLTEQDKSKLLEYLRRMHSSSEVKSDQSTSTPKLAVEDKSIEKKLKVRSDAPSLTALHRTAFCILGATTRDNRRRIVELAEDKNLTSDSEICIKARSDLTNPRSRLSAEVAWLPGLSPKRANAYCALLGQDIDYFMSSAGSEGPLVRANLIAAALELFDPEMEKDDWEKWILELGKV